MIKKFFSIALLVFALCACKETPEDNIIPVASVSLNQTEAEMLVGETLQLQAQISPSNATDKTLMWGSSKQSVATVSDAGLVTAVGEGSAKITVTASGKTATCDITVSKPEVPVVHVESVSLDRTNANLEVGQTLTLTATVLPENADDKSVEWKSANPTVAEVDQNGNVTAVGEGSAEITATAGGKSATCSVTVTKPEVPVVHVESVSLDRTEATMEIGQTMTLTATVLPENADDKSVTWKSTNPAIVGVDQNGTLTAVSSGTVTITATTTDGEMIAGCEVTVATVPPQPPIEEEYDGKENDHRYVDLGLPSGLKWATRNVGATSPKDYGGYYAWGETVLKNEYSWDNYSFCRNGVYVDLKKYAPTFGYGTQDDLTVLEPEDDAAHSVMGGKWFTPTKEEMQELLDNCTFTWTDQDGVQGYKVSSKTNSKSIFLPAGGNKVFTNQEGIGTMMYYWTSSVKEDSPVYAWTLNTLDNTLKLSAVVDRLRGCVVRAVTGRPDIVAVESISLDKGHVDMHPGGQVTLLATVLPENATDKSVTWATSNPNVATVEGGILTAVAEGEATVTATAGNKSATCTVTVQRSEVHVESVSLNSVNENMQIGSTLILVATVLPDNADVKSVTWASTNPAIADVDQTGRVTANSVGTTTVTVTTTDGGKVAGCEVTVSAVYVPVESVTIMYGDSPCYALGGEKGTIHQFTAQVLPINASNKTVTWTSSNPNVATVDQTGKVTLVGAGDAVITAEAGGKTFDMAVGVSVQLQAITLSSGSLTMKVGDNATLVASVYPDDTTVRDVYWESSNPDVVTVDNGELTAVSVGEAYIKAYHGSIEDLCHVIVTSNVVPAQSVTINYRYLNLRRGEEADLTATVFPSNSTDQVTWSISNSEIAMINPETGHVKALKKGRAIITAHAGDKEDAIELTVIVPVERIELNRTELEIQKGGTFIFQATVYPEDADNATVTWRSYDENVAYVRYSDGFLTARAEGTTQIEAMNSYTGVSAICNVTVTPPGAPVIILEQDSYTVDAEASGDIQIKYRAQNLGSNPFTATVSPEGNGWLFKRVIGGVYFYVAENKSTLSRTATITLACGEASATVTITQRGKAPTGPPDIVFDDQFDPNANNGVHYSGEYDNVFYARVENPVEGVELQMTADVPWITNLRPTSNENWYCFTPTRNTTGRDRVGHVILTYGDVTKSLKFVQDAGLVTIILNPGDLTTNYSAKTVSFEVTLPEGFDYNDLAVEPDYDYYWISNVTRNGNTVSFDITDNSTGSERSARIKVSLGEHESYFNITQTYEAPALTVLNPNMTVSYEYQKVAIPVSITNPRSSWTVDPHVLNSPGWIYGSPSDANGNPQVTVLANTTGADRTATVELYYGDCTATVQITQTASTTTITVPESESFGWQAIAYATNIQITDPLQNESLEVTPEVPWIKVNSIVEMSSTRVTVSLIIKKNRTGRARTGNVVFTYAHVTKTMVVSQEANPNIPDGFIDLGLASGTLWAEKNLGAANYYNNGNYYAWGEIATKSKYTWFNYKWASGSQPWNNITKYNETDGKRELEPADDAATVANSHWTIPTIDQWDELLNQCSLVWVLSPVPGYMIYDEDEENHIFLPAAGNKSDDDPIETYCEYWSKSMNNNPDVQVFVGEEDSWYITNGTRYYGIPIRPVWKQ